MLLNVDQLQKQLDKDEFQEDGSMTAFWVVNNQFQKFIDSKFTLDYDSQMTDKCDAESKIDTGKALDADLVNTESIRTDSIVQDDSSRSGNDTDADDADIRPIYDEEPMAEISQDDRKVIQFCNNQGTSLNGQKQQRIDLSAGALYNVKQENLRVWGAEDDIQKPVPESTLELGKTLARRFFNLPDHRYRSLEILCQNDKAQISRSKAMAEQSRYKQDKTITRQSINVKRHIFNVIGGTEEFEERDLNIGGDCTIEEEVYVCQPPSFEDPQFPDKVYKVEKALYGLHQAPRAWYKTLSIYLIENGFRRGTIDKTLFIKKDKCDILLVQVYVDDIIFGSTKKSLCDEFEGLMHKRFQMSSIGELTFFLGLQVQQKKDVIFISRDKYVAHILKKFDFATVKTTITPMEPNKALIKDEEADSVDVHLYRSMIGSLMYLTAFRPDIMFVVYACARFQVTPKMSHLHAVKRIFRYLKSQAKLGLWYPRDSPFDLEAFSDSDYARASLDRKSIIGGCQFLGKRLISWQCKKQTIVANSTTEVEYVAAAKCCSQVL
ncbi:putative ribonuclease H-like domain-containing protein [Tanacetum coccineum]|uniref:Ribonuclease H-like domain-containing protein n=1 Tax=Tanacetum coccineum TaxID=301880 RepID=A0ABQ5IK83_9ASTR